MLFYFPFTLIETLALLALLVSVPIYIVNYFDDYLGKGGFWGSLRLFLQGELMFGTFLICTTCDRNSARCY
jgi:hypothetical protein